jgi:hypothetical protein
MFGIKREMACISKSARRVRNANGPAHRYWLFSRFDIMDHAVLKAYRGIGNVILQISGVNTTRTIEGDPMNNAILLNAHIDSALPSPGAAE